MRYKIIVTGLRNSNGDVDAATAIAAAVAVTHANKTNSNNDIENVDNKIKLEARDDEKRRIPSKPSDQWHQERDRKMDNSSKSDMFTGSIVLAIITIETTQTSINRRNSRRTNTHTHTQTDSNTGEHGSAKRRVSVGIAAHGKHKNKRVHSIVSTIQRR